MYAASSTIAAAASGVARVEAMKNEATAAADTAESWRHGAEAGAADAAAREQAQREAANVSASAAEFTRKTVDSEQVLPRQQERRAKMLVRVGENDGHCK